MTSARNLETVSFSLKGQIVIPRHIRDQLNIEKGTKARIEVTPEGILIRPMTAAHLRSLRGLLKGKGAMKILMEERKRERAL